MRQKHGDPVPYRRTPSPSPPPNTAVARGQEKPRSAKTIHSTHEPHQCALGIKCLLQIDNLNYNRIMATHLVAKALQCRLSIRALNVDRDYSDLARLRSRSEYAAELLSETYQKWSIRGLTGMEELHPMEVLKQIQSPDYWEVERRYLKSPGCLAERQRQKASASTLSTGFSLGVPSIKACEHESPHQESAAEGSLEFTQQGEVMADGISVAELPPLQAPPRGTGSRTPLASPTGADSHDNPHNGEVAPARHPRLMGKNKLAASRDISDLGREQGHARVEKRKAIEDAAVGDDVAPKRRKAGEHAS